MKRIKKTMENEITATSKHFDNLGIIEAKLPFDLFNGLMGAIEDLNDSNKESFNYGLLGHMQEEYSLNHVKHNMQDFLLAVAKTWTDANPGYLESFEEACKDKPWGLYLDNLWVNIQRKHEFNPVHHHSGALSFVIWMKIPYDLEEEVKYFPPCSGTPGNESGNSYTSKFCFYYTDTVGRITPAKVPVDKSFEGTILMFPSSLHHAVYPFYTSDDTRISVSGNIRIQMLDDNSN
jgi:hypothetical protein